MIKQDCIFCQIANHQTAAQVEYEDDKWIVFHDINPVAPVHLLIVPKKHFCWWDELNEQRDDLGRLFSIGVEVSEKMNVKDTGFKLVMNGGKGAGQVIDHFHIHLIGGKGIKGSQGG